ncbi:rfrA family pentapeptide repeat [Crocosphaera subtropica ATCC 51142]|uniref:RfrA family pentapeptide repeat n=2 Tax=Crocosphaera TaxID=263510 RepID=B1WV87_CROS5|nr:rfrA family pentapeptide repeat [Crocosphaera subtropica ATCC 51142]
MRVMKYVSFIIFLLSTPLLLMGCTETTNNLYRLELERECVGCNLEGVNLPRENFGLKYRIPRSSSPLSVTPFGMDKAKPVDLTRANLSNANLYQSDLSSIILENAILVETNLSETDLENAILIGANLQGANLENANLQGANLENANLRGAILTGVNLEETHLKGIETDKNTVWD